MTRTKNTAKKTASQILRKPFLAKIAKKTAPIMTHSGVKKPHRFRPGTIALR